MNFDLKNNTIFLVLSGSRAYGLETEESDYDYRGIAIAPLKSYIGFTHFEQVVDKKEKQLYKQFPDHVVKDADIAVTELIKFTRLALQSNPSIIETLFTDPRHYLIKHPVMDRLLAVKESFLSQRATYRYCGYAVSQLENLKRHKRWLENPITDPPKRSSFGLPENISVAKDQIGAANALIEREVRNIMLDDTFMDEEQRWIFRGQIKDMVKTIWYSLHQEPFPVGNGQLFAHTRDAVENYVIGKLNFDSNFLALLNAEKRYQAAKKDYDSYQHWVKERNPARAKLEAKFGMDLKNCSHCVRLFRTGVELLRDGVINVLRPDAEELRAIRNGAWSYEQLISYVSEQEEVLRKINSKLPKEPETNKIEEIVFDMVMEFNNVN